MTYEVPSSRGRVRDRQANNLLRVDDEDGADLIKVRYKGEHSIATIQNRVCETAYSEWQSLSITVRRVKCIQHVIQRGDLAIRIGNLRISFISWEADLHDAHIANLQSGTAHQ